MLGILLSAPSFIADALDGPRFEDNLTEKGVLVSQIPMHNFTEEPEQITLFNHVPTPAQIPMYNFWGEGQNGFSLIELMVVVAILGILALIALGGVARFTSVDSNIQSATRNARNWARDMGMDRDAIRVTCSGRDSDGDGYVSCSYLDSNNVTRPIECGYDLNWAPMGQNTNCKVVVPDYNMIPR